MRWGIGLSSNYRQESRSTCTLAFYIEHHVCSAVLRRELRAHTLRTQYHVTGRATSFSTRHCPARDLPVTLWLKDFEFNLGSFASFPSSFGLEP